MPIWWQLLNLFCCNIFQDCHIFFSTLCFILLYLCVTCYIHQWDQVIEAFYLLVEGFNFFLQLLYLLVLVPRCEKWSQGWLPRLEFLQFLLWLYSPLFCLLSQVLCFLSWFYSFDKCSWFSQLVWDHFCVIVQRVVIGQRLVFFQLSLHRLFADDQFFFIFTNMVQ